MVLLLLPVLLKIKAILILNFKGGEILKMDKTQGGHETWTSGKDCWSHFKCITLLYSITSYPLMMDFLSQPRHSTNVSHLPKTTKIRTTNMTSLLRKHSVIVMRFPLHDWVLSQKQKMGKDEDTLVTQMHRD